MTAHDQNRTTVICKGVHEVHGSFGYAFTKLSQLSSAPVVAGKSRTEQHGLMEKLAKSNHFAKWRIQILKLAELCGGL